MRVKNLSRLDQITRQELEGILDLHTRDEIPVDRYTAFSWSVSRHNMFERCLRQYYLNYYGARRVRDAQDEAISAVWWLKQVTSRRAFVGTTIHHIAQVAIRAHRDNHPIDRDNLVEQATHYYRNGVRASQRGTKHDGQWLVLFDHVYPDETAVDRMAAEREVFDLTHTFFESEAFRLIRSLPGKVIREIDEPFQSFTLPDVPHMKGGVRVFAIPDVLLHHGDRITIIDWKTGSVDHEGIRQQAGVYRLYAHHTYDLPSEVIEVQIADLGDDGATVKPPGGTPTATEAETFVRRSIARMFDSMQSIKYNTVSIRDFPRTDNLSLCQSCGFKRACWRHHIPIDEASDSDE